MKFLIISCLLFVTETVIAGEGGGRLETHYRLSDRCYQDERGLQCYAGEEMKPPLMKSPVSSLSEGLEHACAVSEKKVRCWGLNNYGQAFSPDFGPASTVVAGHRHSCALGDFGVRCWGENFYGQLDVPALEKPMELYGSWNSSCATDETGLKCWGAVAKFPVPPLQDVISVSLRDDLACAITAKGLKCWGDPKFLEKMPTIKNPIRVSVRSKRACVLDEDTVKCWDETRTAEFPAIDEKRRLVLLQDNICFWSSKDFFCPVNDVNYVRVVKFFFASFDDMSFNLDDLGGFLSVVSRVSGLNRISVLASATKAIWMDPLASSSSIEAVAGRYLVAHLISPLLLSSDSIFSQTKLIPKFEASMRLFEEEIGFRGVETIPLTPRNCKLVWPLLRSSLATIGEFFGSTEREGLQLALRAVGHAYMDPGSIVKRQAAVSAIRAVSSNWEHLRNNPKFSFLIEVVLNTTNWLDQ